MVDLQVTTITGADAILKEEAVEEFKARLRGQMLRPGDEGYEEGRKVWNGMIDRRPGLIVYCTGVADVIDAVNFAREHRLLVAVRGGGHNVSGNAVCDGGIVIDVSQMKGARIDPQARTAQAQAGLTWAELDRETQAFGLATTGGTVSMTGIAGLTLGGGLGWLMGQHGLTCDNLLSVDVVTADARLLTASASDNADLFWGLRGGGGNFGVVTSFEYRLHPVGQVLGGMVIHPFEKAREVLRFYRDFTSTAPDELGIIVALLTLPGGALGAALLVCYDGDMEVGEQVLRPLREFGPPLMDLIHLMAYSEQQSLLDASSPAGHYNYWKSNFLKSLPDEAIDIMVAHFAKVTSPETVVALEHMGGAVRRIGSDETAFSHRDSDDNLIIITQWSDPGESEVHIRWTRELWEAMQTFSSGGVYVNYLGQETDEGEVRVRAAYGDAKYERLVALKNKYDPTNLFRLNQNIKPT